MSSKEEKPFEFEQARVLTFQDIEELVRRATENAHTPITRTYPSVYDLSTQELYDELLTALKEEGRQVKLTKLVSLDSDSLPDEPMRVYHIRKSDEKYIQFLQEKFPDKPTYTIIGIAVRYDAILKGYKE